MNHVVTGCIACCAARIIVPGVLVYDMLLRGWCFFCGVFISCEAWPSYAGHSTQKAGREEEDKTGD